MKKEEADRIAKRHQFLADKTITIEGLKYQIKKVYGHYYSAIEDWGPVLLATELNEGGQRASAHDAYLAITDPIKNSLSVKIAEGLSLEYNEYGCTRLHDLTGEIEQRLPYAGEHQRLRNALNEHFERQAMWPQSDMGKRQFDEIQQFINFELQQFS